MEPQYINSVTGSPQSGVDPDAATVSAEKGAGGPLVPQQYSQPVASSVPMLAEDSDIIEKEWVAAIQKTLDQYKDDPYLLSKAMTALRQDYLQKRYGKTVEAAK